MATENDDFDAAFAEAIQVATTPEGAEAKAAEDAAVAKEMGTAEDPPADAPPADAPPADAPPSDAPPADAPPADAPPADAPPADAPPADAPPADAPPADAPPADAPAAPAAPAAPPPIEEQFPDPVLSEDDAKVVAAFEKDWEDIAPATKVIVGHAVAAMEAKFARTLSQIVGNIYADIEPMAKTYVKTENESFRGTVLKAHEDFDALYPKLDTWIKAQPAYLQTGLLKAYNEGTAEEVIDLVSRYKKDVGVQPQASAPAVAQPNSQPAQPAAAAAATLAPVSTKRTTPKPTGDDPEDYDTAFDEAAAALSK